MLIPLIISTDTRKIARVGVKLATPQFPTELWGLVKSLQRALALLRMEYRTSSRVLFSVASKMKSILSYDVSYFTSCPTCSYFRILSKFGFHLLEIPTTRKFMIAINTYEQLVAEQKRLENNMELQKQLVKEDTNGLKQLLSPFSNLLRIFNAFGKMKTASPPGLNFLSSSDIDLVSQRFLPSSKWITQLELPLISKRFISRTMMSNANTHGENSMQQQ
jgi:hypothetical protein